MGAGGADGRGPQLNRERGRSGHEEFATRTELQQEAKARLRREVKGQVAGRRPDEHNWVRIDDSLPSYGA